MNEAKPNTHYWATMNGMSLVVLCDSEGSIFAAGSWEGTFDLDELTLIAPIEPPAGCAHLPLYYAQEKT